MSAGTTILVDRKTAPLVVDSGILMEGRAQFIKLQAAGSGTLTIVNVYAAQTSRNRALLWKTISRAELDSDSTIIGGDFNHQEETSRRGIAGERQMHRREATSWHHMTLQYSLTDAWCSNSFRKMSKKAFTFDNGRLGANSAISKIDKFMVSQDLDSKGGGESSPQSQSGSSRITHPSSSPFGGRQPAQTSQRATSTPPY
jgi:endonuclease/exonuclease/phosphatase family metal-dependent hydrolase